MEQINIKTYIHTFVLIHSGYDNHEVGNQKDYKVNCFQPDQKYDFFALAMFYYLKV